MLKRFLLWIQRQVLLPVTASLARLENLEVSAALERLRSDSRHAQEGRLLKHGWKISSQGDEDGLIAEIFRRIGDGNRRFLEIGCGDGQENNTLALLLQGWTGHWVEGDAKQASAIGERFSELIEDGRLSLRCLMVSSQNACGLFRDLPELDLLSLDIDGNDYHVLRAIEARPRVIVLEYNAKYRPPVRWVMREDLDHAWDGSDSMGASLSAFDDLLSGRGYALVGCNITGSNAFFVREDLVGEAFAAPFTAENHYEPARYWLISGYVSGHASGFRASHFGDEKLDGLL